MVGAPGRLEAARSVLEEPGVTPHRVSAALRDLSGEEVLMLVASESEPIRTWARRDLAELRSLELTVRGADLLARGVAPGRHVGRALDAVRDARLDGVIGAEQELAHALRYLEEHPPEEAPGALVLDRREDS